MKTRRIAAILSGASLLALMGCDSHTPSAGADAKPTATDAAVVETAYPENAYFGDTHVHTGWSADAGQDGAITTPEDAFRLVRRL